MTKHFRTLRHDVWLPYRLAVGPVFHRFYEGLKEEKIWGNRCPACERILVPPRTFCPECYVDMERWVEVPQEGSVVTWTQINDAFFGMPLDPPFAGGLIRLDGTDCDLLHLIGGLDRNEPDEWCGKVRTGARVKAVWNEKKKGHLLDIKYFQPCF